ncbi:hypothetical protein [Bdellovibrio sp. HCB209]|uniref:hypothetical protein n=1 Tax=Bdellovibrio sp. HCB209 TaxID=3394354 RepID=UPI0039B59FC8
MKTLKHYLTSLVFLGIGFVSQNALAEGSFAKMTFAYSSHESTDAGTSSKTSRLLYDIGAYYKFQGGGWVLGALYQNDAYTSTDTQNRTSYGVSGGYMTPRESGVYFLGTYFISSKLGDTYTEGTGYQIDLGYKFPTKIPVVLQISYKMYDYSKFDHKDTYIDPQFGFMIMF